MHVGCADVGARADAGVGAGAYAGADADAGVGVDLRVSLGGIELANPVVMASGTFGYGFEYEGLVEPETVGAVCVKGITLLPRTGNKPPRIAETPCGLLNSIGLENPGIETFVREHLPRLRERGATVIANIAGDTVEDYVRMAEMLEAAPGIAGIELNVSCPNIARGGMHFGVDAGSVHSIVRAVKQVTSLPVMPKLSPNVTDIVAVARAAQEAGADAISMINTLLGMAIDIEARRPVLGNVFGGLSGPAIKPIALRMVYQVAKSIDLPILGGGGIMYAHDAIEFMMAGATAVSIGTGTFINPRLAIEVIEGMRNYLAGHNLTSVRRVVGAAIM
ncbi:MAG: dihydroorotate dehydrogenase [Firmicutes bacterium]|nr:dihydroorotate dehydrogenase [Bacillota bacterium]